MLKPQYPGQDRQISKMIGERWNNLSPEDKAVRVDKIFNIHYTEVAAIIIIYICALVTVTGISGISGKRCAG